MKYVILIKIFIEKFPFIGVKKRGEVLRVLNYDVVSMLNLLVY